MNKNTVIKIISWFLVLSGIISALISIYFISYIADNDIVSILGARIFLTHFFHFLGFIVAGVINISGGISGIRYLKKQINRKHIINISIAAILFYFIEIYFNLYFSIKILCLCIFFEIIYLIYIFILYLNKAEN